MSKALLKRSLEIVEGSSSSSSTFFATSRKSKSARNPFAPPSRTEQHAEYRAVKKPTVLKAKSKPAAKNSGSSKKAPAKSAIEMAHEHLRSGQSRADENLRKLLSFSAVQLDSATTDKLVRRAQNRKYVITEAAPKVDEATAFTDEDFAKFEREYFCS